MYGVKKRHDDGQSVDYKFKTQVTSKNTVTGGGGAALPGVLFQTNDMVLQDAEVVALET